MKNVDNRIKFRHLIGFLEVARQRSFAKAADSLAISQPAISKTLRELEELLGVRLFERGRDGVSLTAEGVTFMRYAGPSVQAIRDGVNTLHGADPQGGRVRVGVLSTVESLVIPEVLRRLHLQYPVLIASVSTGPSAYLLSQLRVGDLDLVVGRMTDSPEIQGLSFEHLYSEAMTLIVRPGHPLLQAPLDDWSQLSGYPMVLPLEGTTIRRYADAFFVQCGVTLSEQRLETLSPALSRRYVECSDAIWVAPLDAVRVEINAGQLSELKLGITEPGGSVGICTNAAVPLPLAAQWFCEVLRVVAKEYTGDGLT